MDPKAPEKKERLLTALDQGMVMVHLDARRPGVLVPQHLRQEAHLRLNLSYRFDPPDLSVGEWGVRCTLSFGGSRFTVAVPWSALFAITSHVTREFWMFPDDMPPELLQQTAVTSRVPMPLPGTAPAPGPARPRLVLHPAGDDTPESVEADAEAPEAAPAPADEAPRADTAPPAARPAPAPRPELAARPEPVARPEPAGEPPAAEPEAGSSTTGDEPSPPPRRGGHLRLVK